MRTHCLATTAFVGLMAVLFAGSGAAQETTIRVSVSSEGVEGNGPSSRPYISADGRLVVFGSNASNLISDDASGYPDNRWDAFVHDLETDATERVSISSLGDPDNGNSGAFLGGFVSDDGRFVAFTSDATNLVSECTNGERQVFLHDRVTRLTELVSVSSASVSGNNRSDWPSITSDGRFVAFESESDNLVSGDSNGVVDVFVRDRATGLTELVSATPSGIPISRHCQVPDISGDGRYVVFHSRAENLVSGDTNGTTDVFIRDRVSRTTHLVSVNSEGIQGNGPSERARVSSDGRFVAFVSGASNLTSDDANGVDDVFLRDQATETTQRISLSLDGDPGGGGAFGLWDVPSVTPDGRFVAFSSMAEDLVSGSFALEVNRVYVRDRLLGVTVLGSVSVSGGEPNGYSAVGALSADGRFLALDSDASNLVSGDTNSRCDVFVRGPLSFPPALHFATATPDVDEGAATVDLTVERSGSTTGAISVSYASADGTAFAGSDYTAVSDTLTWPAGDGTPRTITVPILEDGDVEGDESFSVTLSNPGGGALLGDPSQAQVTILDNDISHLQLPSAAYSVGEAGPSAVLTVTRTGATGIAVSVDYATADGTATAPDDYTATSGTCSWVAGNTTPCTITVPIANDMLDEGDQSFTLTLSNASPVPGAILGTPSAATVTIQDDDHCELALGFSTYSVFESVGQATVTVARVGSTANPVSVHYATSNGTATAGQDYTAVAGDLSWPIGDATPRSFDVPITDDSSPENDETVNITLSAATGGSSLGSPSAAVLTIVDNDSHRVRLLVSAASVDETAGSLAVTVQREGLSSGQVSVDYATVAGTAQAGADFVAAAGTLTWPDGDMVDKVVNLTIRDDQFWEGPESFLFNLSNPSLNASLTTPSSETVTVDDDEWAELRVNTFTTDNQTRPSVGMGSSGSAVVVWDSYLQDGAGWGVYGQRYDATGAAAGVELRVNTYTSLDQRDGVVVVGSDGRFVVAWESLAQDGSNNGVYAQRFDPSGTRVGNEFLVNVTTSGQQRDPGVAMAGDGSFMVAWQSLNQDGSGEGVYGRFYSSSGTPLGSEVRLNQVTAGDQKLPVLAASTSSFVAVWQSTGQDGAGEGVVARRYALDGSALGNELVVNAYTAGNQERPVVACAPDGRFLVVWDDAARDGSGYGVYARRFSATGNAQGSDFRLNSTTASDQKVAAVALGNDAKAVVAWQSTDQDGSAEGVYAQAVNPDGSLSGGERRANGVATGAQYVPAVGFSASGDVVVVWASAGQDGSGDGVYRLRSEVSAIWAELFADGFESGNTTGWSSAVP